MTITTTDLFAGAGGSSTGLVAAGITVKMAANHWDLAVNVHQANHPGAWHDQADLSQVDPRRYPRTDMAWMSPSCTHHSNASGKTRDGDLRMPSLFDEDEGKPLPGDAAERSRATMWDVVRFSEYHHYPVVLVENVVEVTKWAPFPAWLQAMDSIGYRHEIICHNSMHAQMAGLPAPQSRDRIYIAFWDKRLPRPDWDRVQTPSAWCPRCEVSGDAVKAWKKPGNQIGKYRSQYVYVHRGCGAVVEPGWLPAAAAIDWTLPAQRIGDRTRPLSGKTMARIGEGLRRYGQQHVVIDSIQGVAQVRPVSQPMPTQTTAWTRSLLMPYYGASVAAQATTEPMGTITTVDRYALVMLRGQNAPKPTSSPLDTIASGGTHHGLMTTDVTQIDDCHFRMLEPGEYAAGMAFPGTYLWDGTKRERVRLAGNAVTPPMARDLGVVVREALEAAA